MITKPKESGYVSICSKIFNEGIEDGCFKDEDGCYPLPNYDEIINKTDSKYQKLKSEITKDLQSRYGESCVLEDWRDKVHGEKYTLLQVLYTHNFSINKGEIEKWNQSEDAVDPITKIDIHKVEKDAYNMADSLAVDLYERIDSKIEDTIDRWLEDVYDNLDQHWQGDSLKDSDLRFYDVLDKDELVNKAFENFRKKDKMERML